MEGKDYGMGFVTFIKNIEYTKDPMKKEDLPENGIFIFASNTFGEHNSGSAKFAFEELEAEWGVGEGLTGRTYAFPTLNYSNTKYKQNIELFQGIDNKISIEQLSISWNKLIKCIEEKPDKKFYLTKIGLGIAGFDLFTIHKSFWDSGIPFLFNKSRFVYPIDLEMPDDCIKNW